MGVLEGGAGAADNAAPVDGGGEVVAGEVWLAGGPDRGQQRLCPPSELGVQACECSATLCAKRICLPLCQKYSSLWLNFLLFVSFVVLPPWRVGPNQRFHKKLGLVGFKSFFDHQP